MRYLINRNELVAIIMLFISLYFIFAIIDETIEAHKRKTKMKVQRQKAVARQKKMQEYLQWKAQFNRQFMCYVVNNGI